MLLVATKYYRCTWFSIPNAAVGMEPEYCNSTTGAGISGAGSRGCHYRRALTDVLLFRKMPLKAVGLHLLPRHPITKKLKVVFSPPPLSVSDLKK